MRCVPQILKNLGISDVYSIDDEYAGETISKEYRNTGIEEFLDLVGDELSTEAREAINDAGPSTVADLFSSTDIDQKTKDSVERILGEQAGESEALTALENAFRLPDIEFHKLTSVDEIRDQGEGAALWLVDRKLHDLDILAGAVSAIDSDRGAGLLPNIIVIYTYSDELAGINSSWQERYKFLNERLGLGPEQSRKLAYSVFVISKTEVHRRLEHAQAAAVQYIDQVLTNALTCYCASNIISAMKSNAEHALDDLSAIAKDSTRSTLATIYYNMVAEGEPNSYRAFQTIFQLMQEAQYIGCFDRVEKFISAMKSISLDRRDTSATLRARTIEDIVKNNAWTRYQYAHTDVNLSYADVLYGDIFKFTYNEAPIIGILITQPCDCVIRKNERTNTSGRRAKDFTMLTYSPKKLSNSSLAEHAERIQTKCVVIDYRTDLDGDGWEIDYIDLTEHAPVRSVPCFMMDLLSLDRDGNANLLNDDTIQAHVNKKKSNNWNDYCPILCQEVVNVRTQIEKLYDGMGIDAKNVVSSIYGVDYLPENGTFCIQRLGRLTPNLTAYACFEYLSHTYRVGKDSLIALHGTEEQGGE